MLEKSPEMRISAQQALQHPYFDIIFQQDEKQKKENLVDKTIEQDFKNM